MKGETKGFLGEMSELKIYKIGLSISPSVRLSCFQRALPKTIPEGRIKWELHRSTRLDKNPAYPNFEAAEQGENAMKNYLSKHAQWLGGEFYAATEEHFERAWKLGHEVALNFIATGVKV
jgi:hypothetical protein